MDNIEYELVGISYELLYDFVDGKGGSAVADAGEQEETQMPQFECDANGIPIGESTDARQARKELISKFWSSLKAKYPDPQLFKIHNTVIDEDIYLRFVSYDEAREHSSKSHLSTLAFLRIEDVLANARPVGRVAVKPEDKNQRDFEGMLIMTYEYEDIGRIKLTIGLRRRTHKDEISQKVEYAVTHLPDGAALMPPKERGKKKKTPHKK